jgi:4-hydroxythreonine-4-phosphate dehydrogenase
MHAPSLLILADDLSGAADCAATAVQHGARASVALTAHDAARRVASSTDGRTDHAPIAEQSSQPDAVDHGVLAIDLDSRRMTASDAAQIHRDAVRGYRKAGGSSSEPEQSGPGATWHTRIFKKVDSTLRGHLAAEVAALAPLLGLAIVAPALPEAGRTTEGGRQLLHGIPVEETEVWRNEKLAGTADLVAMLQAAGLRVSHRAVSDARGDTQTHWRHAMESARAEGAQALVCDARTTGDLDAIARASIAMRDVFWVGSAGLARSLTHALADAGVFAAAMRAAPVARSAPEREGARAQAVSSMSLGGALFVVGSMSSVSHAQITALRAGVGDTLLHVAVDVADVLGMSRGAAASAHRAVLSQIRSALDAGRDVVVSLAQDDRSHVGDGYRLAQAFGAWLSPVVTVASAVFATGGETARALLSAAEIGCFALDREIVPGVPMSWASLASGEGSGALSTRRLSIVTKAGAFGDKDTLVHVWRYLKAQEKPSK